MYNNTKEIYLAFSITKGRALAQLSYHLHHLLSFQIAHYAGHLGTSVTRNFDTK
jgi:hypothetical protein